MTQDPFPRALPTHDKIPLLLRPYFGFAATRVGSWFTRSAITPVDDWLMRISRGRLSIIGSSALRVLVLTSTGRKSGQHRETALTYIRDDDRLLVLGSNFGQPHHPAWSANLLAHPDASVTIGGATVPVTAAMLTGEERQRAIERFLTLKLYSQYDSRAGRELRLFALSSAAE